MAGSFQRAKYSTDTGTVVNVRVQPETLALDIGGNTNDEPSGNRAAGWPSAKVSGGRRTIGINCRSVSLQFTGTPPTGYKALGIISVPIMTKATYDLITQGDTGTYLGAAVEVIGKSGEVIK